jgi:predicted O-methyltransferase YrrM
MKFEKKKLKIALSFSHYNFIYKNILSLKNINILEFGVNNGFSTSMFLDVCNKNLGSLISVDVDDYSGLFKNDRWTFLKCRDDNFDYVKKNIKKKLDVIYIDSFHEPNHIAKILFFYYRFLKKNGTIFIDDISWIPYVKNSYRTNSWNEIINRKTFSKILEIYFNNLKNLSLEFCFDNSGIAKLTKKTNKTLNGPKIVFNTQFSLKNYFRRVLNRKPKK